MTLDYGIRISQPGYDAKTCTDAQCVFTSKNNTLKILSTGSVSITIPANTASQTTLSTQYNHNLGFVPAILVNPNSGGVASSTGNDDQMSAYSTQSYPNLVDNCSFDYDITSTYIKFYLQTYKNGQVPFYWPNASQIVVNFKYFIFTQQIG